MQYKLEVREELLEYFISTALLFSLKAMTYAGNEVISNLVVILRGDVMCWVKGCTAVCNIFSSILFLYFFLVQSVQLTTNTLKSQTAWKSIHWTDSTKPNLRINLIKGESLYSGLSRVMLTWSLLTYECSVLTAETLLAFTLQSLLD